MAQVTAMEYPEQIKFKVYWKKNDGTLDYINSEDMRHDDAILAAQETLIAEGEGYNEPILALIQGGKA